MNQIGFDSEKYLEEQSAEILRRAARFRNKLYLEFGGKLAYDFHAARILPGYDPNVKMKLLQRLKDQIEVVICIYAGDIERKKIRADFGIAYDADTMRIIDSLRSRGILVRAVVVTRYESQPSVDSFIARLIRRDVQVHTHPAIQGYPADVDRIVSDSGYGANSFIETERPIVIVTGPGGGSGKMATCLSQVYHEQKRGSAAGYAKFETFPVWNLPLNHPVNIAYEAATADIGDVNMVDPFHLDAYGATAVNYNRDVETFPVLRRIMQRIMGDENPYNSPTDMGVNRIGFAITDDAVVCEASRQEVIRRWFRYRCEYALGGADKRTLDRVRILMDNLNLKEEDRAVVEPARLAAHRAEETHGQGNEGFFCGAALQLPDGRMAVGMNSSQMHAAASCIVNALKALAHLPDELPLIAPAVLDSVAGLKRTLALKSTQASLDVEESLIALSVSAASNPAASLALGHLENLYGCEMHMSHLPAPGDAAGLRKLGVNVTSDPCFASRDLFME